jgi:murein DD-endopeptidase MepM/ murein hydrolase activator NlpD
MRILITFVTLSVSVLAGILNGGGGSAASAVGPPCVPTKNSTVWSWPLAGTWTRAGPAILRPFEPPRHRWNPGHRGVDLAGYSGEPILAAGPGIVLFAGRLVDRGVVVIGHGVIRTSYEPVDPALRVGARVTLGERIGTLDPGHCASGACLHWGLLTGHRHGATYFDPLLLLGCGQVRLEPVKAAPGSR